MITKIFYSLVLFPEITYNNKISGYHIYDISENSFWEIKVFFLKENILDFVVFTHNDFKKNDYLYKTKNWQLYWNNKELIKTIYKLVLINEADDFNFFKNKKFYDTIPFWVVMTITSKCNLLCNYCFNDYDYSLKDRNIINGLWLNDYKSIIDKLYEAWTRDIIITWWEPFISPDLFEILTYIKSKWIFIRVNTNWTLLYDNILQKLNEEFSLNLMISMHEFNNKDYYETNKLWALKIYWSINLKWFENKFEEKISQLKKIKNYDNISMDFLTILTSKNILYLERIYKFIISNFKIENWHFFRLYSTENIKWISKEMINLAIHKIYKLNNLYKKNYQIVDSIPFCVTKDIEIASNVIDWELSTHHNIKTIITPKWDIQMMCSFDSNLWNIFNNNIEKVWQWEFVQKMLNQGFLPDECYDCKYKAKCRGWSRMQANIYNWSYKAKDPFTNLNNKVII